jgi:hypothetical protein
MFTSSRYMTKGIQDQISLELQIYIWSLIDSRITEGEEMDYLQVFMLNQETIDGITIHSLTHKQEEPPFEIVHQYINNSWPLNITVWVIDVGRVTTMLLPSEY